MFRPPIPFLNFVTLHYAYIVTCSIFAFIIIYPYGNLKAVDAFFFGCSANTESGLNTVDVKALKTYQQLVIYFFPIITNLGFVNIVVVLLRLRWFEKRLKQLDQVLLRRQSKSQTTATTTTAVPSLPKPETTEQGAPQPEDGNENAPTPSGGPSISWAAFTRTPTEGKAFRVPSPREQEKGLPLEEVDVTSDDDEDKITLAGEPSRSRAAQTAASIDRIASSMFVVGDSTTLRRSRSRARSTHSVQSAAMFTTANSKFDGIKAGDWKQLGGMEYRALRVLLRITTGYFFGLHAFGVICLLPWIYRAPAKYQDYLASQGQNKTWWYVIPFVAFSPLLMCAITRAFYSSQTMVNNLGFTLTPDSMITFADATWPLLVMTFLAYAGNTCYPIMLRLTIWTINKMLPKKHTLHGPLEYLLAHPRRCYTLLFPGRVTWILFGILFALNFVDVLLIIVLDLNNSAVTSLPAGPRVLAALFQAASARHTGTATFNLAEVSPGVQFSLLVMMYIAVFPIAISIRASNNYDDTPVGKYEAEEQPDDNQKGSAYIMKHVRNQLSFDLWYVFLGTFCITIAEAGRIADNADPAFSVFSIMFEVVSAYGNVGLSLGYPTVLTSLCGKFTTFSKLVICAMMIRGRHRGLPFNIDRAINIPGDELLNESSNEDGRRVYGDYEPPGVELKKFHTK